MDSYAAGYTAAYGGGTNYGSMIQRSSGSDPLVPEPMKGRKRMATPDAATMRKLQAQGKALKNASGKPSFQVRNAADLDNAIMAVGRVKPGPGETKEQAMARVRRFIMTRAKQLGLSSRCPGTWSADGSLKDGTSGS